MHCNRCGTEIKNIFRVGELIFGSDCILKINDAEFSRIYFGGQDLPLSKALLAFIKRNKRAKSLEIDLKAIPEVGAKVQWGGSTIRYEVVGYNSNGIRVKGFTPKHGTLFNDVRFDKAHELTEPGMG